GLLFYLLFVGECSPEQDKSAGSGFERLGLLFYLLFVGECSPEQDKSAGSGFERCAATARRVAVRRAAISPGGAALTGATDP
ncbi:hypothetical protein, partial [Klebsiella aerogenes]|uniref:hypothetical protein n=1 Tax=Klebsiella aerogenes TaxID=548 RepID=UPI001BCC7D36